MPATSYEPGLLAGDVGEVLAASGLPLADRLRAGLAAFGATLRGYVTDEAVLVATESRTSSPVRVRRDPATLESPGLPGLYPTGEGAGFAGGIVSAAMDGIRVARVPAYSPYAVAEHAVALILGLVRRTHRAFNRVRDGNFALEGLLGYDIHGKRVGVVGTGRIGAVFARIMAGFGCELLAYDLG